MLWILTSVSVNVERRQSQENAGRLRTMPDVFLGKEQQ